MIEFAKLTNLTTTSIPPLVMVFTLFIPIKGDTVAAICKNNVTFVTRLGWLLTCATCTNVPNYPPALDDLCSNPQHYSPPKGA